ncbi:hypothetical protein EDB80DRAFT_886362 [Ilyonectria destructans]|nr:hypothetical protein EDB80DRAFT_886362 [Ilyonectria destructans]
MDPVRNPQAPEPAPMDGTRSARQMLADMARACGKTVEYFVEQYNMECNRQRPEYGADLVRNFTNPGLMARLPGNPITYGNYPQPNMGDNNVGVSFPQQGQIMNVQPATAFVQPVAAQQVQMMNVQPGTLQHTPVKQGPAPVLHTPVKQGPAPVLHTPAQQGPAPVLHTPAQQGPAHPLSNVPAPIPGTGLTYNFNAPMGDSPIALSDEDAEGEPVDHVPVDDTRQLYHSAGPIPSLNGTCDHIIATHNPSPAMCRDLRRGYAVFERGTNMVTEGTGMIEAANNLFKLVEKHQERVKVLSDVIKLRFQPLFDRGLAHAQQRTAAGNRLVTDGKALRERGMTVYFRAEVHIGNDEMFIERIRYLDTLQPGAARDALTTCPLRKIRRGFEVSYLRNNRPGDDSRSRDSYMLRARAWNFTYKEIKDHGGLNMPEPTMRGRVRGMVRTRRELTRVTEWDQRNVNLLRAAVAHYCAPNHTSPEKANVAWKVIRDYVYHNGGERFSSTATKKQWEQLQRGN